MVYEEVGGRVIGVAPIAVGAGAVDLSGVNAKCMVLFVEFLRDRRNFSEVGSE